MRICIPTTDDNGLESTISGHFGSSPYFLLVDTETAVHHAVSNTDLGHAHGMCQPLSSLGSEKVDAFVVGCIGHGALTKLHASGLKVYITKAEKAREALAAINSGTAAEISPTDTCSHHGQGAGSGCGGHLHQG